MDPVRIDRADPAWAADLVAPPRPGAGCGRVAGAPAGHRSRRRDAVAAHAAPDPDDRPADARGGRDRDPFVPVDHAWRLSRSVLDGRLLVLPDAGHEAFAERPAIATEALGDFYRSTEAVARRRAGTTNEEETA